MKTALSLTRADALALAGALALTLTGCGANANTTAVEIFAAASLSTAGADLETAYEQAHPGVDIVFNYAGSSKLLQQIGEGATPDILITADTATMTRGQETLDELADTTPHIIATNTLVLATAPNNPANIRTLTDLATDGTLTALCAIEVPCGRLAHQALTDAGVTPASTTEETSVSGVATKIATGQVDAGFIYTTDATAISKDSTITTIQLPGIEPNAYPLTLTTTGTTTPAATDLATWLTDSSEATTILTTHGFTTP